LLPKNLFLHAPYRLLRAGGPLFFVFLVLFLPISGLLWGLNRILAWFVRESPEQVRLTLARHELQRILEEGHAAGILHPSQRSLAQVIFATASLPVTRVAAPLRDVPRAREDMSAAEILRLARRYRISTVAVEGPRPDRELIGYVRVADLALGDARTLGSLRRLVEIPADDTYIVALTRMQSADASLARVVDARGQTVGILTAQNLREPLFRIGP
jgi:CBS domain containing-hemolysin-like protein